MIRPSSKTSVFVATERSNVSFPAELMSEVRKHGNFPAEMFGDMSNKSKPGSKGLYTLYELVLVDRGYHGELCASLSGEDLIEFERAAWSLRKLVPKPDPTDEDAKKGYGSWFTGSDVGYGNFGSVLHDGEDGYATIGGAGYSCYVAVPRVLE